MEDLFKSFFGGFLRFWHKSGIGNSKVTIGPHKGIFKNRPKNIYQKASNTSLFRFENENLSPQLPLDVKPSHSISEVEPGRSTEETPFSHLCL